MQSIACSSCDIDDWWYFHKNIRLWVARTQLTFQMLTLLKNIYIARESIQIHGTANIWPW